MGDSKTKSPFCTSAMRHDKHQLMSFFAFYQAKSFLPQVMCTNIKKKTFFVQSNERDKNNERLH